MGLENNVSKVSFILDSVIRSCGRFGPASEGTMLSKSNSTTLL